MVFLYRLIIMGIKDEKDGYFCYLTIYDDTEYIVFLVIMGMSLLLAMLGLYKFCQLRGSHNKSTSFVYSMLLLWWLSIYVQNRLLRLLCLLCCPLSVLLQRQIV